MPYCMLAAGLLLMYQTRSLHGGKEKVIHHQLYTASRWQAIHRTK